MSQRHPIIDVLIDLVGDRGVLHDPSELHVYESDGFTIAKGLPLAVVFPRNTRQVAACVKAIGEQGLQIIGRGTGTGLAGGAVAFGNGVLLSTSRMNTIESIDINNRVAVVQAGVMNLSLSEVVATTPGGEGLHYSPDPSSQRACTIGGNVATNAGGINTLKHGVTSNHILGLEMVLADGSIVQTRTNKLCDGIGPDLPGLICGSEGTLAIITRVWCRLVPDPPHFRTIYAVFDSTYNACQSVSDTIAAGIIPTSMEMMDGAMIKIVEEAFHYGFPTHAKAMLLIEIDGLADLLDDQLQQIVDICEQNHAFDTQPCSDPVRRAELWSARKRAFGAIGRASRSYCTQDACVPRSKLPEVVGHICKLGEQYGIPIANVFHAGDGNVHPIMMFDEDDPDQVQTVMHLSTAMLEYCVTVGGTITGEHGVGVEKLHLMHTMFTDDTIDTFNQIKQTFDPDRQLNDGKLVPSDRIHIELFKPTSPNMAGGGDSGGSGGASVL